MGSGSKSRPIVQMLTALKAEGIRFMLAGMSAANLQGVMEGTVDVDIWIDLPSRQYMRVVNLCLRQGGVALSPNKVHLSDDTPIDFIYEVTGLRKFASEFRNSKRVRFHGVTVNVLTLAQVRRSKRAVGRDKDKLHVLLIDAHLRSRKAAGRPLASKANPPAGKLARSRRPRGAARA
jgi:hypothetical protein